jgi:uncharacterized protein YutE (UPF0331/DUF86 family)
MSDREVIIRKVDSIQNCMQRIVETSQDNPNWLEDFIARDAIVLNLIKVVQFCVGIAGCIITEKKWGIPRTLGESFYILKKNHVIDHSLMEKLRKIVGFRNVVTHAYKEINYKIVKSIIDHHLIDFEEFYTQALKYSEQLEQ